MPAVMHRLTRKEIETLFVVALATADKVALGWFRSRKPLDREKGREMLAADLAAKVDNNSSMVLVTEPVSEPIHRRPGKWGVDEPDPTASAFPEPPRGTTGSRRLANAQTNEPP